MRSRRRAPGIHPLTALLVTPFFIFGGFVVPLVAEGLRSLAARRHRLRLTHVIAFLIGAYLIFNWGFVRPHHVTAVPESAQQFARWQLREVVPLVAVMFTIFARPWAAVTRSIRAVITVGAIIAAVGVAEYVEVLVLHRQVSLLHLVHYDAGSGFNLFSAWLSAHNAAGGLYAALAAISLWWFFEGRVRFWVLGANLLALVLTLSRSGYLGFVVVAIVYFVRHPRRLSRRLVMGVTIGAAVTLALFIGPLHDRFVQAFSASDFSRSSRLSIWSSALHHFSAHPIFGIGWSNFQPAPGDHAHNSYLQVLAELGLVGFILIGGWLASVIWELHKARRYELIAGIGTVMVSALLDHNFGSPTISAPLFVLAGMAITADRIQVSSQGSGVTTRGFSDGRDRPRRRTVGPRPLVNTNQ
jgi:O-antigen ligase